MISSAGGKAVALQGDVTNPASVEKLVAGTRDAFGGSIDLLVNVAGGLVARKTVAEMDHAFWNSLLALNLTSVFTVTRAVLPFMPDGGTIVNFSSQAGRDGGGPGAIAYATAKGGVMTLTRGLAKELGPRRIRVNAVAPGMINTTFHDTFTKAEVRQRVASMTPLGREGEAREVANLVAFLATPESSFVNGATIDINGGILFS
jgi:3-oxoacyl-[acyl-carrier protein] reductase